MHITTDQLVYKVGLMSIELDALRAENEMLRKQLEEVQTPDVEDEGVGDG